MKMEERREAAIRSAVLFFLFLVAANFQYPLSVIIKKRQYIPVSDLVKHKICISFQRQYHSCATTYLSCVKRCS